jgi:hypothetical protein
VSDTTGFIVAVAVGIATLIVHTGALFYWGGAVRQMLRDHDRRITNLEEA